MHTQKRNGSSGRDPLVFFQQFLRHPLQIGSVIPSSRFLERRVVKALGAASAKVIVELGPGTGGVTRAILRAMPAQAKLLSIEINPLFHRLISSIDDSRLIAHLGSATDIDSILTTYGLSAPDVVVSGIPFSTMSPHLGTQILAAVSEQLAPKGRFVAYQMRDQVATLCKPLMGTGKKSTEFLNIPPMRVFQWEKQA